MEPPALDIHLLLIWTVIMRIIGIPEIMDILIIQINPTFLARMSIYVMVMMMMRTTECQIHAVYVYPLS